VRGAAAAHCTSSRLTCVGWWEVHVVRGGGVAFDVWGETWGGGRFVMRKEGWTTWLESHALCEEGGGRCHRTSELPQFEPKSAVHYITLLGPPKGPFSPSNQRKIAVHSAPHHRQLRHRRHTVTCDHNEMACDTRGAQATKHKRKAKVYYHQLLLSPSNPPLLLPPPCSSSSSC